MQDGNHAVECGTQTYAFDWGNARYYVLEAAWSDTNGGYQGDFEAHWNGPVVGCPVCGTELQWLQTDLAAHAATKNSRRALPKVACCA